jgi:hypothetical protein
MSLEDLVASARENGPHWDRARASRVLASTVLVHERRTVRARVVRRVIAIGSASAVMALLFFRVAPSSGAVSAHDESVIVSVDHGGDGGYARD